MTIDGVLLLGFGGPEPGCCSRRDGCSRTPGCEAPCFVAKVLGDDPTQAARVAEVAEHYRALGGFSPYNAHTRRQAEALCTAAMRRGRPLRVGVGFRHWTPWFRDGLAALAGCRSIVLLPMAPHHAGSRWEAYAEEARAAAAALGAAAPPIAGVVPPWGELPGHVRAIANRLDQATTGWSAARRAACALVFTAHAIPLPAERACAYRAQVESTAREAAAAWGHPQHFLGFQSAPAVGRVPWSQPTVAAALAQAKAAGASEVLVQACGFPVDHVEVLWDLDREAAAEAARLGLGWTRAAGVGDEPALMEALLDAVLALDQ